MSRKFTTNKGFTFVELVVSIALIGVLFLAVAIYLTGAQKASRDAIRKNDVHSYYVALAHYYQDHHTYPDQKSTAGDTSSAASPGSIFDQGSTNPLTSSSNTTQQSYMSTVLRDPTDGQIKCQVQTGAAYTTCQYSYLANKTDAVVWGDLENPSTQGGVYFADSDGTIGYASGSCTGPKASPCQ